MHDDKSYIVILPAIQQMFSFSFSSNIKEPPLSRRCEKRYLSTTKKKKDDDGDDSDSEKIKDNKEDKDKKDKGKLFHKNLFYKYLLFALLFTKDVSI